MEEVWKDIEGYEGLYQISNMGRVKRIAGWHGNRFKSQYREQEQILSPWNNGNGYLVASLVKNNKRKNAYVHRLVTKAFLENPRGVNYINHLDHDRGNNRATNLEWCTQRENVLYSVERMRKRRIKPMTNTGERYVSFSKNKYRVSVDGKEHGRYDTIEEAIAVRDKVLKGVI